MTATPPRAGDAIARDADAIAAELATAPSELGIESSGVPEGMRVPLQLEEVAMAIVMTFLVLITLANVVTRYLTNISFAFTEEYSHFLIFILVFIGTSAAIVKNEHISVTFVTDFLSHSGRRVMKIIGLVCVLIVFGLCVHYGGKAAWDAYIYEELSPGLGHPQWLYIVWMPILSAAIMLRTLGALIRALRTEG